MKLLGNVIENLVGVPIYYCVEFTKLTNNINLPNSFIYKQNNKILNKFCEFYEVGYDDFDRLYKHNTNFIIYDNTVQTPLNLLLVDKGATFRITFYK